MKNIRTVHARSQDNNPSKETRKKVRGEVIQETDLVGVNTEDVDSDLQRYV